MQAPNIKKFLTKAARSQALWAALFVVVVGLAYFPAVSGPFFFDDEHFILKNQMVHSLSRAGDIYKSSVTEGSAIKGNFYRPNQQMVFAVIYQMAGVSTPVPYHLVSMMLHTLNGVLFQAWLIMLGVAAPVAGLMALFFLIHPAQTEAVSYISGLADPLALLFIFGGLLWYGRALKRKGKVTPFVLGVVPALVWLCLALLCKENAVVFAPMALASSVVVAVRNGDRVSKGEWLGIAAIGLVVGIYIVLKMTVLSFGGGFGLTNETNVYTENLGLRLTTFVSVIWDYAVLIFFPKELFYEKVYLAYPSLLTPRGVFGIVVIALLIAAMSRVKKYPELALGAFLFGAGLLPFTGIIPLNAMYLEHWLYIPMLGVAMMFVFGLTRIPKGKWRIGAGILFGLLMLAAGARTFVRNIDWSDIESFYLNELAHGGQSTRIYNNLGMYYADQNDMVKSITYYKLAVKANGSTPFPQPHHNLARAYAGAGKLNDAVEELRLALAIDPNFTYSLGFLKEIFAALKDERRAQLCAQALQLVQNGQTYDVASFNRDVFGR